MRYAVNPMARRTLGATSDQTTIDTTSVLNVGDQLRAAQADLLALTQAMQQNQQLAQAIGRDVIAQQVSLGDLITKYVAVYTAVFGNPPVGLGNPAVIALIVAATFVIVVEGIQAWQARQEAIKAQAQSVLAASQNQAALIAQAGQIQQQANVAAAAGDTATASTLQARATQLFTQAGTPNTSGQPAAPTTLLGWLQANWVTAALIVGAVIVIPKVAGEL